MIVDPLILTFDLLTIHQHSDSSGTDKETHIVYAESLV